MGVTLGTSHSESQPHRARCVGAVDNTFHSKLFRIRSALLIDESVAVESRGSDLAFAGHGKEIAFLNGILPQNGSAYPEKNISIDQLLAQRLIGRVRFPSIHAALERGIRMSWNGNGVEIKPIKGFRERITT